MEYKGTIDMIFTARQVQEKSQEQNVSLYMTFVDLTKSINRASRETMVKFDRPPRFVVVVWQLHDDMQARVKNDGEFLEPLHLTSGVKQSRVMAPTLFRLTNDF